MTRIGEAVMQLLGFHQLRALDSLVAESRARLVTETERSRQIRAKMGAPDTEVGVGDSVEAPE